VLAHSLVQDIMDLPDREEIVEKYRKEAYGDE